jgi:hypothetical protein
LAPSHLGVVAKGQSADESVCRCLARRLLDLLPGRRAAATAAAAAAAAAAATATAAGAGAVGTVGEVVLDRCAPRR